MTETDLRYPIGRYAPPDTRDHNWCVAQVDAIVKAPAALREAVRGLDDAQLDTPYRPGGWSVRQVTHHVPDSHMNAFIRLKLALTEEVPTVKPYDEEAWAKLIDAQTTPIETSLALLDAVHDRMVRVFRSMDAAAFARRYRHPESGEHDLAYLAGMYAWHGAHHVAHITSLRTRMGW